VNNSKNDFWATSGALPTVRAGTDTFAVLAGVDVFAGTEVTFLDGTFASVFFLASAAS
jgi:hypothetical protein